MTFHKICIVGDEGVGKSSLVRRLFSNSFGNNEDVEVLSVDFRGDEFYFWGSGSVYYNKDLPSFYSGASLVLICYSGSISMEHAMNHWAQQIPPNITIMYLHLKADVNTKNPHDHLSVSAKENHNLEKLLETLYSKCNY